MNEYAKQEILPNLVRSDILKKVMMLKSWFDENMNVELTRFEYNYVSEYLLRQTKLPYSNRDLFDIQIWSNQVPAFPGESYREQYEFDKSVEEFMNSVGLNWDYWGKFQKTN